MNAGRPPPRLRPRWGWCRGARRLELLEGPVELALLGQQTGQHVTQLDQHLDVEGGVHQPVLRQRPPRPVRGAVPLLQPQAEQLLDQRTETDPRQPGQPAGQLGVEQQGRDQTDLGQARQILMGGMQHPLRAR